MKGIFRRSLTPLLTSPPSLSDEQLSALMDRLQAGTRSSERRLCALVTLMLETGGRAQELSRAEWEDFDRVKNRWTPMGRSVTPLPMSEKAWDALASLTGPQGQGASVFQRYEISAGLFKVHLKALGLEPFPLVMLRKDARRRLGLDAPSDPTVSAKHGEPISPQQPRDEGASPPDASEPAAQGAAPKREPRHLNARELVNLLNDLRSQGGDGQRIYGLALAARRTFAPPGRRSPPSVRGRDDPHLKARWELLRADREIGFAFLARLDGWPPDPIESAPVKRRRGRPPVRPTSEGPSLPE